MTVRDLRIVVAYVVCWIALDLAAALFEAAPEVSLWYPPSALDVALLLAFGLRYWPAVLITTPLHLALVGEAGAFSWVGLLVFDASTTAGYAGAAAVLLRVARIDPGLRGGRDVVWFVAVGALAAPLLVAVGQVLNLTLGGGLPMRDLPVNVLRYWAGDATGIALLAPPLLILARRVRGTLAYRPPPAEADGVDPARGALDAPELRAPGWLLPAEVAGFLVATWAAYGWQRPASLDYSFFVWVPLIWTALRYGFERVALFVLALNLAVAILSRAQFGATAAFSLQFGLLTLSIVGLLLGAASTEMRRLAARLRYQSLHDALTGLPNRRLFRDRLEAALSAAPRTPGGVVAVAMIDLDHFRDINDTLGHPAGDAVLKAVAQRLRSVLARDETLARLGADEFAILLPDLADAAAAEQALERMLRRFDAPLDCGDQPRRVSVSIGATLGRRTGDPADAASTADHLLREADLALYRAKDAGRACVRLFSPEMTQRQQRRLEIERDLDGALERGEFLLAFQPQIDCATGRVVGAEALLRWAHPRRGLLAPGEFLAFAGSAGLLAAIGDWVMREACARAATWADARVTVAVNVAPVQWRAGIGRGRDELIAVAERALAAAGLPPARLKLEVTEELLLRAEEARSLAALAELRSRGVRVSIDDFGTGHSGLSRLRRLPFDEIKIDRSFLDGVGTDRADEAIVQAVVALGRALGCQVVAEGVETGAQLAFLREVGCDVAQGFLFGQPLDPAAFAALLARQAG